MKLLNPLGLRYGTPTGAAQSVELNRIRNKLSKYILIVVNMSFNLNTEVLAYW